MAARVVPAGWVVALLLALASALLPAAAQADAQCDQPRLPHASLDVPDDGLPGDELHRQAPAKKRRPILLLVPVLAPDVQDAAWVLMTQPAGVDSVHSVPAPAAAPPRPRDRDPVLSLHRGQAPPTA